MASLRALRLSVPAIAIVPPTSSLLHVEVGGQAVNSHEGECNQWDELEIYPTCAALWVVDPERFETCPNWGAKSPIRRIRPLSSPCPFYNFRGWSGARFEWLDGAIGKSPS